MNFTIYGNPVEHSKSPQMHNAGFDYLNFDGKYTKTYLENGTKLKDTFLNNNMRGANITVPHKENAFKLADEVRGMAQKIGAVNTYIEENGKVLGYNTDALGFMMAIKEYENIKKVLLLGAGGTAKAIAVALIEQNIDVVVLNRSQNRLDFFKELGCEVFNWENFELSNYDLIVNSTSAGLKDENLPVPKELIEKIIVNSKYAFDCIYGKMTPFLKIAKEYDLLYKDGEDMLLYQGVIAFELFTNTKADNDLVETMRKGLKG
jgi:shikimate dehydrogenase